MAGGKEAKESMITLKIPGDRKLLAAVGKVALRSSLLDLVMRMTIKVITGVSVEDALRATASPVGQSHARGRELKTFFVWPNRNCQTWALLRVQKRMRCCSLIHA